MRTTLAIDDDVLTLARAIARERGSSVGAVVSALARKSMNQTTAPQYRNGFELFPVSNPDTAITMEILNELRDDLPRPFCLTSTS